MSNTKIAPEWFINMKARINAEMNRRNRNGSLVSYAGSPYQYTNSPSSGNQIALEHMDKLITPMRAVNPSGKPDTGEKFFKESERNALDASLIVYEGRAMTASENDCNSLCSGLCSTMCTDTCGLNCTGCTGGCTSCTAACANDCDNRCDRSCADGCGSQCGGGCTAFCRDNCDGCTITCFAKCADSCLNTCSGSIG